MMSKTILYLYIGNVRQRLERGMLRRGRANVGQRGSEKEVGMCVDSQGSVQFMLRHESSAPLDRVCAYRSKVPFSATLSE